MDFDKKEGDYGRIAMILEAMDIRGHFFALIRLLTQKENLSVKGMEKLMQKMGYEKEDQEVIGELYAGDVMASRLMENRMFFNGYKFCIATMLDFIDTTLDTQFYDTDANEKAKNIKERITEYKMKVAECDDWRELNAMFRSFRDEVDFPYRKLIERYREKV